MQSIEDCLDLASYIIDTPLRCRSRRRDNIAKFLFHNVTTKLDTSFVILQGVNSGRDMLVTTNKPQTPPPQTTGYPLTSSHVQSNARSFNGQSSRLSSKLSYILLIRTIRFAILSSLLSLYCC